MGKNEGASFMKRGLTFYLAIVLAVAALLGCGAPTLAANAEVANPAPAATIPAAGTAGSDASLLAALEGTLENVYADVSPSVVNIEVVSKQEAQTSSIPQDSPFFRFFEPPQGETPQQQTPPDQYQRGSGSGFVWDTQGHIVTNNHVVENADKITVNFTDGSSETAQVVGTDPDSDLAVIKVDHPAAQLKPVVLGDSTQLKVGQMAIAIGNPFGLEGTMTVGIISSLGRLLPVESQSTTGGSFSIPDIIQTDAPINPGNSGGVLVDDQGEVIGVTSAIISPVRASAGIGFAIPSAIVDKVVPTLINQGQVQHPWLGISGTTLTPELAQAAGLDADQQGALVVQVVPNGPADNAGLHGSDQQVTIDGQQMLVGGDVIVAFNGEPVSDFDSVVTDLNRYGNVGGTITLTILRDGKQQDVQVKLEPRPSEAATAQEQSNGGNTVPTNGVKLGISGETMTPAIAEAMGLPSNQEGVLVSQVDVNSPADEAGLLGSFKPATIDGQRVLVGGDVIVALNGNNVSDLNSLQQLLQQAEPGQNVTLTVLRDGRQINVSVTLGE